MEVKVALTEVYPKDSLLEAFSSANVQVRVNSTPDHRRHSTAVQPISILPKRQLLFLLCQSNLKK